MLRRLILILCLTVFLATPAFAAEPASSFSAAQKKELAEIIKKYIASNPKELIDSVEAYYNTQADSKAKQEGTMDVAPAGLLDDPNSPSVGPKDAKVTVVEFFDYNCGYCKQVATDVQSLVDQDKTVRVIFKDIPILSESSELAARYALAAHKQGKYLPFHMALMTNHGPINQSVLEAKAKEVGLDLEKLKKDAETQDIRDQLAKDMQLAGSLGVRGTPFFIVGKQKIPGAVGLTRLKEVIAEEGGTKVPTAPAAATTSGAAPTVPATTSDPEINAQVQQELANTRAEAQKMIEDVKKEAAALQAEADRRMKEAQEAQKKEQEKAAAKN